MNPTPLMRSGGTSPTRAFRIARWDQSRRSSATDEVAVEEPLELRVDTQSLAVIMRTPGHDEELAAGFLLSEGLIRRPDDLRAIRPYGRNRSGNVLDVFLAAGRNLDVRDFTRHVFASSSCGLCGKASIASICQRFPAVRERFGVAASVLRSLPARLRAAQLAFATTGGLHAAAVFSLGGEVVVTREDVGRHNAVDKVLGRLLLDGQLPAAQRVLLVSGRASFEILQKALAAGVGVIAAVGAPSSLAVEFARSSGQTLVGFLRDGRFNVYAGRTRVRNG